MTPLRYPLSYNINEMWDELANTNHETPPADNPFGAPGGQYYGGPTNGAFMYATGPGLVRHTGTGPTQSNPALQPHVPGNATPPNFEFEEFINYDPDGVLDPPTRDSVSIAERRAAAEGSSGRLSHAGILPARQPVYPYIPSSRTPSLVTSGQTISSQGSSDSEATLLGNAASAALRRSTRPRKQPENPHLVATASSPPVIHASVSAVAKQVPASPDRTPTKCYHPRCRRVLSDGSVSYPTLSRKGDWERHRNTVHGMADKMVFCGFPTCKFRHARKDKVKSHWQSMHRVHGEFAFHVGPGTRGAKDLDLT